MAKTLANYDPLVQIPSGMTPAGADFPIVESHDILVGENDKRLDAKLDDIDSAIGNVGQTPIATQQLVLHLITKFLQKQLFVPLLKLKLLM